jgi:hypothetical protein
VSRFHFGDVEVDFEKADVKKQGKPILLAGKELDLIALSGEPSRDGGAAKRSAGGSVAIPTRRFVPHH